LNLVLLRLFGPEQFGIYTLAVTSILLVDAVLGSAIDMGVLRLAPLYRGSDPDRSLAVERAAVGFKLSLGLVMCLVLLWLAAPIASHFFQAGGLAYLVYLSVAASIAMLLLRSAQVHMQVEGNFVLYGIIDLAHFALKFGGIAALVTFGMASPGLALSFFVFGPVAALALFVGTRGFEIFRVIPVSFPALGELLSYVKWFLLTFCLASLLARIDLFLLSSYVPMAEVGILSAAYVLVLGFELLGTYLAVVYSPRVMPLCSEGRFGVFYRRFQTRLLTACVALFVLAVLGIRFLGSVVLPPSFDAAAPVFLILLPGSLGALATFPVTLAFVMFIRPRFIFALDCLSLPVLLAAYAYAIPRHGAMGAAFVTSTGRLIKAIVIQLVAWRQTITLGIPQSGSPFVARTPSESWQTGGAS